MLHRRDFLRGRKAPEIPLIFSLKIGRKFGDARPGCREDLLAAKLAQRQKTQRSAHQSRAGRVQIGGRQSFFRPVQDCAGDAKAHRMMAECQIARDRASESHDERIGTRMD